MTDFKIVFLDIDGTTLRPDDTIEQSTRNAIIQLQQKGIEVVLATGRPLHEIRDIGNELSITSYIAYNGAIAVHKEDTVFKEPMKPELVENLVKIAKGNKHDVVFYTANENAFTSLEADMVERFIRTFHLKQNTVYHEREQVDILGATIITTEENSEKRYQLIEGIHLSQVNVGGMRTCHDVIRDHVNKGVAVKAFLSKVACLPENAIAFGDGMNDKEMLSYVGAGFAMGNAHPDLFTFAKYKTTDVNHSGIFNGLQSLGLVE
ncbi:Cof-type HAD-IIB family hydrolase [Fredinandcohnia humi]